MCSVITCLPDKSIIDTVASILNNSFGTLKDTKFVAGLGKTLMLVVFDLYSSIPIPFTKTGLISVSLPHWFTTIKRMFFAPLVVKPLVGFVEFVTLSFTPSSLKSQKYWAFGY